MKYWKVYFLAYLIKNIQKVNVVGPVDKNERPKRYGGPCRVRRENRKKFLKILENWSKASELDREGVPVEWEDFQSCFPRLFLRFLLQIPHVVLRLFWKIIRH